MSLSVEEHTFSSMWARQELGATGLGHKLGG